MWKHSNFIFPNPASAQMTFELGSPDIDEVSLIDINGKTVNVPERMIDAESFTMSLEAFNPGMYLVMFKSKGMIVDQQKVMIIR